MDSGIPVVTTNADIDRTKRSCCVGVDSHRGARIAGRMMGLFLGGRGKIAVVSSAIASENNNYYVQVRETEFADFIHKEYPDIEIITTLDSFEDSQITYEKTVKLLRDYQDLQGIYITCGGVSQVGWALEESGREKDIRVISFEDSPEVADLIRKDVIDCTLAGELQQQGEIPVQIIMDHLVFGKEPTQPQIFTDIRVLVKESLQISCKKYLPQKANIFLQGYEHELVIRAKRRNGEKRGSSMANPEYILEMRDIVKVFPGVRALDGVKLQVRRLRQDAEGHAGAARQAGYATRWTRSSASRTTSPSSAALPVW